MKKFVLIIIGIIFLVFLSWRIITLVNRGSRRESQRIGRPPVAVQIVSVRYGPIQEIRQFTGTVYPLYKYIVAPKVSGRITEIRKRIGDWVQSGEIIAKIDDAEYQQAVLEAEANLKIAQAALTEAQSQFALAKQELERIQSLQAKGITSPAELDAALTNHEAQQSRLKLAKAQVEQREASLNSAKIRLGYTVLTSAEPGFIGERYVDEGSLLAPNSPVVSVVGIDTVIIRTTIIERDYGRILPGQVSEVQVDAYPLEVFTGRVARIAPIVQEASRVAQMEIEVANDSLLLKPGMFSRVQVVLTAKDSAQIVPREAIVTRDGGNGVFVVDKDETIVRYFPVQMGIRTAKDSEIISPKLEGWVVTLGQHLLEDGSQVILPKKGTEATSTHTETKDQSSSPRKGTQP